MNYNKTGKIGEDAVIFEMKSRHRGRIRFTTRERDLHEGTDMLIDGMPVDFSLNPQEKNYMVYLDYRVTLQHSTLVFGVRFGNGHRDENGEPHMFKDPVLVIGIIPALNMRTEHVRIAAEIAATLDRWLEPAVSEFWEKVDEFESNPQWRSNLVALS